MTLFGRVLGARGATESEEAAHIPVCYYCAVYIFRPGAGNLATRAYVDVCLKVRLAKNVIRALCCRMSNEFLVIREKNLLVVRRSLNKGWV